MFAVQNKNLHLARVLLKNNANINKQDVDGFTALTIAIDSDNLEICKLLLEYNPEIKVNL
jgi:ankyrin repeat protein